MEGKKTLILGVGNELLSDDGIGPKLVKEISKMNLGPDIICNTVCCGGLEIVEQLSGFRQAVLIDAIITHNGNPGTVYHFRSADFIETFNLSNLHDINFLTGLQLAKKLEMDLPSELHILGVEIIEGNLFSENLSSELEKRYTEILKEVILIISQVIHDKHS